MFEDQNATLDSFATKVQKKDIFMSNTSNYKEVQQYNPYVNNNGTVVGNIQIKSIFIYQFNITILITLLFNSYCWKRLCCHCR